MLKTRINGRIVCEVLARRGLSQGALARQLDISPGYLSLLLRGLRCPGPQLRPRIQAAPSLRHLAFEDLFELVESNHRGAA